MERRDEFDSDENALRVVVVGSWLFVQGRKDLSKSCCRMTIDWDTKWDLDIPGKYMCVILTESSSEIPSRFGNTFKVAHLFQWP